MKYCASLKLNSLTLMVNLGYGEAERKVPQEIRLNIELYFSNQPLAALDDGENFICYFQLSEILKKIAASGEFRLIEYLSHKFCEAMEVFLQAQAKQANIDDIRYVLHLHKCHAPVDGLEGGATYSYSNLEQGII